VTDDVAAAAVSSPVQDDAGDEAPARARRRRSRGTGATGSEPSAPAKAGLAEGTDGSEPDAASGEGSTRTRRRRLPGRRRREQLPLAPRIANKIMLITENEERDQIAVIQDRLLVEHYITRSGAMSMVGNIYMARVQNVLPGMEAAFVDIGRGRNAVLYAGEVAFDEDEDGPRPRIEKVLKSGQTIMVQVTKDPIGGKGARVTQEISLPGRYVVFVPKSDVFGISRRLPDPERQRLKRILKEVKPEDDGLIVRTAAEGASEEDLRADLQRLTEEWAQIQKSSKKGKAPKAIYEEPELTVRVVRDLYNEAEFTEMLIESPGLYERVTSYLKGVAPELLPHVKQHTGKLSLFESHHVIEQIHKALDRKVWLPSGGYLVIDKTEAMTVVDVNTGKHVGKANLEETVTKTNVEAADEVARQLRLRDIGGIIIIDFIDMLLEKNRTLVRDTLAGALAKDKTKSQVFDIGPLGLLEVTRKRVSSGLLEAFSHTCPTCEGRGIIVTHKL
jgi:ribonuclease E